MRAVFKMIAAGAMASALFSGCFYDTDGEPYPLDTDSETDSDSGVDAGDTGIGTECSGAADCEGLEADYCMLNPQAPGEPGYCTILDCQPGGCPDAYECCDCEGLVIIGEILCIDDVNAATVEAYGCTCD